MGSGPPSAGRPGAKDAVLRLRLADVAQKQHLAGAGNWLWRMPLHGRDVVLKVYTGNRHPLLHVKKTLGNVLVTGRTSHMPRARCRHERACLDLWERHGFRCFPRVPGVRFDDLPDDTWLLFEHVEGRAFRDLFGDAGVPLDERLAIWRRFLREWHRRHRLAVDLRERRLVHENGDVKHVLLQADGGFLWFDFEVGFRSRDVRDLVGREVLAYMRSAGRFFGEVLYDLLMDELVVHYPDKALLYEACVHAFRNRNPAVRAARAFERATRPRHGKRFSKYAVAHDLQRRLRALSLGSPREGNLLWRVETPRGTVLQKRYEGRGGGPRQLLREGVRATLAAAARRKTSPSPAARRATERALLAGWRQAGIDVPADLTDAHPALSGPLVAVHELLPGQVLRDLLEHGAGLARAARDGLLLRFARAWRRRHDLAVARRDPTLLAEHGSVAHVLVDDRRLWWIDHEVAFRAGQPVAPLLAKEVVATLRTLHRRVDGETFRSDLATLVRGYGHRPRLHAVAAHYLAPGRGRALLWRLDRLYHRGESRVRRKYEVVALLAETLAAEDEAAARLPADEGSGRAAPTPTPQPAARPAPPAERI